MATHTSSKSSVKSTPASIGCRSAPITTYDNGHQLPLNTTCHLMSQSRGLEQYGFGPSFRNSRNELMLSRDEDSDNPTSLYHSLPVQDFKNVTKQRGNRKAMKERKTGRSQGSTSPVGLHMALPFSNVIGLNCIDQTIPKYIENSRTTGRNDSVDDRHSSVHSVHDAIAETLKRVDLLVAK